MWVVVCQSNHQGWWCHMQKRQWWFYPLSHHLYILGVVVACFGMYGHGDFRWPHFFCFSFVPPILLLVLPIQPFTMYTTKQVDGFWHVSHMLGIYGVEMSFFLFFVAFSLCIKWGNLDVLWHHDHTFSMHRVKYMWYQFLLCLPFASSAGNDMLPHCCFPFPPSSSSSSSMLYCMFHFYQPHFMFSHLGLCSYKLVVFSIFTHVSFIHFY